MKFTTIFATALLVGSTSTSASTLRRNRVYDVTKEFGRQDDSDAAMESLFRELAADDINMRFLNCMSYSMSMDPTPASDTSAPSVPTTPAPTPAPIDAAPPASTPTTTKSVVDDIPSNDGDDDGCTFDASAFENDESAQVLLKIDVDTVSASTDFLEDLIDAMLASLQEEFALCQPSGSGRTLSQSNRRRLEGGDGITGVTIGDSELPTDESCTAASIDNTCHVVYSNVVVYGASQEEATNGADRVVASLQENDYASDDVVDVRVTERTEDDGSVSNGVSNSNNELGVEAGVSSGTGSTTGLAVGLSVVGAILIATIAVVALGRKRPADGEEMSIRKEFVADVESDDDCTHDDDDEETFVNPLEVPQPADDATARSMRRMDTVEI
eukprot:CAMPEP_0194027946 /NCGR_PEP_ID=MMETSP0009_2-20130614/1980_1 /TAXON_ID=210454 /ORGANISM="Grammatophora oceanica, Strain CCMP 410" /LENGTH=384 /DNA_ID=CAMNT_0038667159 /DNA_START=99 /DNA_END=1253 /DNA_ORIENTATION=+